MSTEPIPINGSTTSTPSQVTEETKMPEPVVPSTTPMPPQTPAPATPSSPAMMAVIQLSKQEAVNIMTSLLNGLLDKPETFQPQITVPMDRIKIGVAKN